jgi:hypothetical protein
MVTFKQTTFYIEGLQPAWLEKPEHIVTYRVAAAISYIIGPAIFFTFITRLLICGVGMLAVAIFASLVGQSEKDDEDQYYYAINTISFSDRLGFSLRAFRRSFGFVPIESPETRTKPNLGLWRSSENALRVGCGCPIIALIGLAAVCGVTSASLGYGFKLPYNYLQFAEALGAIGINAAMVVGGLAVIKHLVLRLILWRSGDAPLNYARFLDYCASAGLLRKVGGGYIFVHRYLLEYFAGLEA